MKIKDIELHNERNEKTIKICREILKHKSCVIARQYLKFGCSECCFCIQSSGCAYIKMFNDNSAVEKYFEEICKLYLKVNIFKQEELDV